MFSRRVLYTIKSYFQQHPTLSHGIIACTLFSTSDYIAQVMERTVRQHQRHPQENDSSSCVVVKSPLVLEKDNSIFQLESTISSFLASSSDEKYFLDMQRFLSAGIIGAFFGGIVYPIAYRRLDKLWGGKDFVSLAKKSIVEIFSVGIFVNSVSIGARGLLVGHDMSQVLCHVKEEMPMVTYNDARIWGPYNMIAFGLIPVYIRPATTSLMEAMWQTYISLRSNAYDE